MDPTSSNASNTEEEEEWGYSLKSFTHVIGSNWLMFNSDADGFEIPSLNTGKPATGRKEKTESGKSTRLSSEKVKTKQETIYLGPHGAPPKGQEVTSPSNRKHRLKQKLKDAEKKATPLGRENKVEVLRDLIGSKSAVSSPRAPTEGWLEPYCHENQFERAKRPA